MAVRDRRLPRTIGATKSRNCSSSGKAFRRRPRTSSATSARHAGARLAVVLGPPSRLTREALLAQLATLSFGARGRGALWRQTMTRTGGGRARVRELGRRPRSSPAANQFTKPVVYVAHATRGSPNARHAVRSPPPRRRSNVVARRERAGARAGPALASYEIANDPWGATASASAARARSRRVRTSCRRGATIEPPRRSSARRSGRRSAGASDCGKRTGPRGARGNRRDERSTATAAAAAGSLPAAGRVQLGHARSTTRDT